MFSGSSGSLPQEIRTPNVPSGEMSPIFSNFAGSWAVMTCVNINRYVRTPDNRSVFRLRLAKGD
jgi:hypothetical protein